MSSCSGEPESFFKILSLDKVAQAREREISDLATQLEIPASKALILLKHFDWNVEQLLEKYFDSSADYFAKNGIPGPDDANEDEEDCDLEPPPEKRTAEECNICSDTFLATPVFRLSCGHATCPSCTFAYLKSRVFGVMESVIRCPGSGCNVILSEDYIRQVLRRPEGRTLKMYRKLSLEHFLRCHSRTFKPCVTPNCLSYWKVDEFSVIRQRQALQSEYEVRCDCIENFCFYCAAPWHFPLRCKLANLWESEMRDDNGSTAWIIANAKKCPKCKVAIQKNGGCNVMRCSACKAQFCWVCLTLLSSHGFGHTCAIRPDNSAAAHKAGSILNRFVFTSDRFQVHRHSYAMEKRLLDDSAKKMADMQQNCRLLSVQDAKFYEDAIRVLLECRRLLQFSFPFVYYLNDNSNTKIFEMNMNNLHQAVETLSGYLESGLSPQKLYLNKQKVLDLASFCKVRKQQLVLHVDEGYRDKTWSFTTGLDDV